MPIIEWDDKTLSVGIELIDSQHKILVSYINELSELIDSEPSEEAVNQLFKKLVDYTQYHFDSEEEYFESLNDNDLILHKLQHRHFIEQLNQLQQQCKDGIAVSSDLLDFLLDWLIIHIQCEDKKFIQDTLVSELQISCTNTVK